MSDDYYWIAINGRTCAASAIPMRNDGFRVSPTPEQLVGFPTRREQLQAQEYLLTKPIKKVNRYMQSLGPRVASGDLAYIRPSRPEQYTTGQTLWLLCRK